MIRGGVFGGDQDKKQMRQAAIQGRKIDAARTARKHAQHALDTGQLAVRNRHSFADRSSTNPFPFEQNVEHFLSLEAWITHRNPLGQFLHDSVLLVVGEGGNYRFDAQKIGDFHDFALLRPTLILAFCLRTWLSILSITRSIAAYISWCCSLP